MSEHQRRPSQALDDLRHGERLPRAGHSQQNLVLFPVLEAPHQRVNSRLLIAARLVIDAEAERGHMGAGRQFALMVAPKTPKTCGSQKLLRLSKARQKYRPLNLRAQSPTGGLIARSPYL